MLVLLYFHTSLNGNTSLLFRSFYTEWNNSSQGVCVCVCVCACVCARSVTQPCLTLCNLMDCSPPGSSVHENFQARILERVVISSSRGSSQSRDQNLAWQVDSLSLAPPGKPWQGQYGTNTIMVCRRFSSPFLPSLQQLTTVYFSNFLLSFPLLSFPTSHSQDSLSIQHQLYHHHSCAPLDIFLPSYTPLLIQFLHYISFKSIDFKKKL